MKFQLKSLLLTYHIFSYFDFHSLLPVKKNLTEVFHVKPLRLAFSFLPPVRFEIFTAGFSSRIFIFPLVHWLKKSDYSSLQKSKSKTVVNTSRSRFCDVLTVMHHKSHTRQLRITLLKWRGERTNSQRNFINYPNERITVNLEKFNPAEMFLQRFSVIFETEVLKKNCAQLLSN